MWAIILALLLAVIFSLLLTIPGGRRGPGPLGGVLFFIIILFLAIWAGTLWAEPFGPAVAGGFYWLPFLVIGIIVALLIAALVPPAPGPAAPAGPGSELPEETRPEVAAGVVLSVFFWVLLILLIGAVIAHYAAGA